MSAKIKILIMALTLGAGLIGCQAVSSTPRILSGLVGSGNVVSEDRPVSNFHAVRLAITGELKIEQGDQEALTVSADDNIIKHIVTEVRGGELIIRTDNSTLNMRPSKDIEYKLTVKNLDAVTLSGSGKISAEALKGDRLTVTLSGSGDISLDRAEMTDLHSVLSGSGKISLGGQTQTQNLMLSGSGQYKAEDLQSQTADVTISGSGDATVWAAEKLNVQITGSGNVDYYGNPQISSHTSGSGRLESKGSK